MNIRVYAPNPIQQQLQTLVNKSVTRLESFFNRIKTVEVFFKEDDEKVVEMKLYLMHRVLYTADHGDAYEEIFENAAEKMRLQLMNYKKEMAIY
jgi:ribosome-associated translation inhibitor RaiA